MFMFLNSGSSKLQKLEEFNQYERNRVQVDRIAGEANRRQTTSVLQDQSFFSEKTTQVNFHPAVAAVDDVFIDCRSSSRWQLLDKVSGGSHPKPGNILPAISIDRVRADFFGSRNVGTGHDHLDRRNNGLAGCLRRGRDILR